MTATSDVEKAERLGRRRARMFFFQGLIFMIWQTTFYTSPAASPLRTVDAVKISAWLVWAVILLVLLATGGFPFRGRAMRALLDDELTKRNRTRAYVLGFWMAMFAALAVYVIGMFEIVTGREAVHIILSIAIGSAIFSFGVNERRSARAD
jgi:hypothetical protein